MFYKQELLICRSDPQNIMYTHTQSLKCPTSYFIVSSAKYNNDLNKQIIFLIHSLIFIIFFYMF